MPSGRFLIVDGHNLLFRMFYGMPARIQSSDSRPIHAVYGFTSAMLRYIKTFGPGHAVVVFDSEEKNFRYEAHSEYKAVNRRDFSGCPDEETPWPQLNDIKKILDVVGISHCEMAGFEADDVVASWARKADGAETHIVSGDSDLLQLVNDHVFVYMDRGKQSVLYDRTKVIEKFGIGPERIVDYKALVGDTSDNVRGVPGIGPKTAARLINTYGSVDEIRESCSCIEPRSLSEKIRLHLDQLESNRALIRLHDEVDLGIGMGELAVDPRTFDDMSTMGLLRESGLL